MYLKEGETLTLETLLYGLLLCSGNDAAVAIAQHVGGSVKGFVAHDERKGPGRWGWRTPPLPIPTVWMTRRHYSTARDMAKLARAALENETLMRIASTRSVTIGGRTMHNHNKLLSYMDNCLGLKTGYTKAAGPDAGKLCGEERAAADRRDAAGRQRLGGSSGAVRIRLFCLPGQDLRRPGKGADPGGCQRRRPLQRTADRRGELLLAASSPGSS